MHMKSYPTLRREEYMINKGLKGSNSMSKEKELKVDMLEVNNSTLISMTSLEAEEAREVAFNSISEVEDSNSINNSNSRSHTLTCLKTLT